MKKALIVVIAAIGLVGSIFLSLRNEGAVATSAARPWPGGMGTLDAVAEARWPPLKANDASVKLTALANALPKNEAVDDFVTREIARGELTIGEPPALPDVSAIRELLLREPIVWERDEGIGGGNETQREAHGADDGGEGARCERAGESARKRSRGVGRPARRVEARPHAGRASADDGADGRVVDGADDQRGRLENAAARAGVARRAAGARQRAAAARGVSVFRRRLTGRTARGYFRRNGSQTSVEHDRLIAEELFNLTRCDVNTRMNELGTDLSSVWRRAFRYRAEREATANALRVREGKSIETGSRCSDGGWTFDGTTLRFSREIATAAPDRPMPLVLRVKP